MVEVVEQLLRLLGDNVIFLNWTLILLKGYSYTELSYRQCPAQQRTRVRRNHRRLARDTQRSVVTLAPIEHTRGQSLGSVGSLPRTDRSARSDEPDPHGR